MKAVIFGGGKIARGFIGQLLYQSGFEMTFVDVNTQLIERLNAEKKYYVHVMGHEEESQWIDNFHCVSLNDIAGIRQALETSDIGFTAVGGKNLEGLAGVIAAAYEKAAPAMENHLFTIICCENWKNPADQLMASVLDRLPNGNLKDSFSRHIGISEAAILRSGVEATDEVQKIDANAVSVTSYWELPVDRDRIKGEPVEFKGVRYQKDFDSFLQRKIYTFNTINATIAYIGSLRGMGMLCDAANDPDIVEIVKQVQEEINPAIAAEMKVKIEEQKKFADAALKKYQDKSVVDFTERHARDPVRKMGPSDRITGTLRLVEKHGLPYSALATTLAAALFYQTKNKEDSSAQRLHEMLKGQGIDVILKEICKIDPQEKMALAVKERVAWLKERGWLDG